MAEFRMLHVDHYISKPVVPFDDSISETSCKPISKVPVIRVFGVDSEGRKICLHVHGFYPYVAIQNPDPYDPEIGQKLVREVERSLQDEVQFNRSSHVTRQAGGKQQEEVAAGEQDNEQQQQQQQPEEASLEQRLRQERRPMLYLSAEQKSPIHRVEPVTSYNYYGYHKQPEPFLKLHLYSPRMVKQLAQLFSDCKIFSRFIPVFWAHLPYILLFFIDNNLRGMQFIALEQLYWRRNRAPQPTESQLAAASSTSSATSQPPVIEQLEQHISDLEPTSTCELEADARFEWIANKRRFGAKGNDDALRKLWLDDQECSQGSSVIKQELPLYSLELSYLEQLCDSFGVNISSLNLELTDKATSLNAALIEPSSQPDETLQEEEEEEHQVSLTQHDEGHLEPPATVKQEQEDDGFSDDDEFLIAALSRLQSPQYTPKPKRQRYSDNSMIDGRSVIGSTENQTRPSSSQRSSSCSRETLSHEYQYFSMMSMELHISTRDNLRPDPIFDPIEAVFYCIRNDVPDDSAKPPQVVGIIITDFSQPEFERLPTQSPHRNLFKSPGAISNASFITKVRPLLQKTGLALKDIEIQTVETELELIIALVEVVKAHDPEILLGYEMEQLSWGYLLERSTTLNIGVSTPLSRIFENKLGNNSSHVQTSFVQPIMFTGRMVFSTWRIIKHEINLNTCSYEKIHHHALKERVPCFSFGTLTRWYNQNHDRWRVIDYYLLRVIGQMRILDKFDLIAKVSELARVYGTQFIDVITRGSQIGIESMMLRLAKLQNLTPLSPTVMQRNKMKAPEALPLVMEPETNIYYDPVAVLDFQSLYPSVVIAYNYCYSTCLGRVNDLETKQKHQFGCSQLHVDEEEVKRLLESKSVHVSPCGVAYVKKNIKHGILPKMLSELITTRAMVKDQMKKNAKSERPNQRLQRILDHRQHGLKMMANTTYGYAGASYTGRMPCVEIADSIVSKGRETLENAIEIVESRAEWGAKVIYGDTDSIFIQFRNCDKDTAFKRAYEMVEAISAANPYPIKMKFEKIYQPCVLQTKKRYCGFKYEFPEQVKPEFEAKGIETVRRDCCPAAARMLEMALRIQFTTRDVAQVKEYVQHQFVKIMSGKLSNIQDFIFARQYKPRDLDKVESVFVPAWQISKRLQAIDPRSEPRLNERVPFVIIYGEPGTPLVNLAKTPMEVLENLSYRINSDYYIQKIICPTLNRIFCTMGIDTLLWYKSMPHHNIIHRSHYLSAQKNLYLSLGESGCPKQSTMSQYFSPAHCPVCAKSVPESDEICDNCQEDLQASVTRLTEEISRNQKKLFAYHQLCRACCSIERSSLGGDDHYNPCISYDCENLFRYHQAKLDALNSNYLSEILKNLN